MKQFRWIILACVLGVGGLLVACNRIETQSQGLFVDWHTFHSAATASASGTAMDTEGYPALTISVEGISGDTVQFEQTVDASTWYSLPVVNMVTGAVVTSTTADGMFYAPINADQVRCELAYSAGAVTVLGIASTNDADILTRNDVDGVQVVDATGQGDVPITLDSEVVSADATGQGDVPITLDSETVTLAATESHLGEVGSASDWITLTTSLDTGAYAANDVLADTQELASAVRVNGGNAIVDSIVVLDEDDNAGDLTVVFFRTNVSLGTENSAVSITDANARQILCSIPILSSDYDDLVGSQVATLSNVGCLIEAASGTTSVYVGLISNDTKTYTASGIQLAFGLTQD